MTITGKWHGCHLKKIISHLLKGWVIDKKQVLSREDVIDQQNTLLKLDISIAKNRQKSTEDLDVCMYLFRSRKHCCFYK